MDPMFLQVACPCCIEDEIDIDDSLVLLGDDEQNMQCLHGSSFGGKESIEVEIIC